MIRTNLDRLVCISIMGCVAHPVRKNAYRIDVNGKPFVLPGVGGITYNVKVGDPAFGWAGDHIEPAVSTVADMEKRSESKNSAYNQMACIGNEARVVTGDAKGSIGTVTGHHGGIEHVLIDFDDDTLEKLCIDDKIQIKAVGMGLELLDYSDIIVFNTSPTYLVNMGIREEGNRIVVPVSARIPGHLMGSGIGSPDVASGDYDITTTDRVEIAASGIDKLRLGDIVALDDCDNLYGRSFRKGSISIGIVVHSDCLLAGHGPGVATLMTSKTGSIVPEISSGANIADQLNIGRCRC